MKMRTKIILGALLLNAITYVITRIWWGLHGGLAATLDTHIGDPEDDTMTYLIAGNSNQADTAFDFMRSEFGANYTFVQFNTKGWSPKATARVIKEDIYKHKYRRVRIFTISLGDHVARYLESSIRDGMIRSAASLCAPTVSALLENNRILQTKVYAINPCPNRDVLQSLWDVVLHYATPAAELLCHALGWISYLPIVPSFGGRYSLALLIDQYWSIYYDYPPMRTSRTYGVVYSTGDTFLDNDVIKGMYLDADLEKINTGHSDIVNSAEKYHDAICNLLKED